MLASVAAAPERVSVRGPVWRLRLDPLADRPDAVGQHGPGLPAEVSPGPVNRERAGLQLSGHGRRQRVLGRPAGNLPDHRNQVEHADLSAGADVPGPRPALVCGREERGDSIADVDVVAGLGAIAEDGRTTAGQGLRAEDWDGASPAGRSLPRAVDIREPQDRVRRSVQPVVEADILLGAVLADTVR